ncbi:SMP-30/gluconolactonase/LRE family protein [Noviherbaspirillum suwonense]|uniref:Sugar lactone lactonase YvrE n=1 Tax=Noviherbaspirillum suwonense TaxID=1224511 RepID=A0ABY1PP56_9BURK|nr:Sugar lactone lactonase YvrE [Noviherbaspirillum suwonense]
MSILKSTFAALAGACMCSVVSAQPPSGQPPAQARLQQVAAFEHQVTGVTVAKDGRIFVNFPRWTEDAPVSVAEVASDGSIRPYPDQNWNAWRNAKRDEMNPGQHFVCVQSVVADDRGNLWVLDPAAPAQGTLVPGGPKLVKIDLASNQVKQTIAFDEKAAPQGSYLNDVRFSADGRLAYITDSGAKGALLVVDLASGKARRLLDGHPSTQPEKGVVIKTDGKELRRPDGRGVEFAADGIALSPDGKYLYWQAIKGRTLYRIATSTLADAALPAKSVEGKVEKVGENGPADGLLFDKQGRMYISAVEENAVKVRDGDKVSVLLQDEKLRWPDTFAQGPDGAVYVTSSRIMDMNWFKPENPASLKTTLFRIEMAPR